VTLRDYLDAELASALRGRDRAVISALRSALSALANAEAIPAPAPMDTRAGTPQFAGAVPGLGAGEAPRIALSEEQQREIVAREAAELASHAERLVRLCRRDEADGARRGARVLTRALDAPG
jgi:hypothetical protein